MVAFVDMAFRNDVETLATHFTRCPHGRVYRRNPVEGGDSRRSAFYPEAIAGAMIVSLFP